MRSGIASRSRAYAFRLFFRPAIHLGMANHHCMMFSCSAAVLVHRAAHPFCCTLCYLICCKAALPLDALPIAVAGVALVLDGLAGCLDGLQSLDSGKTQRKTGQQPL
jgi:hypothetical protein